MADEVENTVYRDYVGTRGAVLANPGGKTVSFTEGTEFINNYAYYTGGAIYNEGTVNLTGTVFTGNTAGNAGGAIANSGTLTLNSVDFLTNTSGYNGGALYCIGGTVTGNNITISGNYAANGGGIYCFGGSADSVFFENVSFTGNTATYGGAIYNYQGSVTLESVLFSGNTATKSGGAIYNDKNSTLTLNGGTFAKKTDTIINRGTMIWTGTISVSGEVMTTSVITATGVTLDFNLLDYEYGNSTAIIADLSMISGVASYSVTIGQAQTYGTYTLAGNASAFSGTVKLKGLAEEHDLTLSNTFQDANGASYTVAKTSAGDLTLTISRIIFADVGWTTGSSISAEYKENTYTGTVGDGSFFNDCDAAKSAADNEMVIFDMGIRNTYFAGDGLNLTIQDGTLNKQLFGGNLARTSADYSGSYTVQIDGGTYNKSSSAGDAVASSAAIVSRDGDITLVVNGGTFGASARLCGGMFYNPSDAETTGSAELYGSIDFQINGGIFNGRIYGGSNAGEQKLGDCIYISGDVNITVSTGSTHSVTINECLVAGSRGAGVIEGSTNVTFTGDGSYLTFGSDSVVFGGSNSDFVRIDSEGVKTIQSSVGNSNEAEYRNLVFSDFNGNFGAEIRMFGTLSFNENSQVEFNNSNLDLWSVEIWNFEFGSSASGIADNQFKGDTLKFDMTGYDDSVWNVLSGSTEAFSDFAEIDSVSFGDSKATYDTTTGCWTDGTYKLSLNESGNGMLVSKC